MPATSISERPTTRAVVKYNGRSPYKVRHVVGLIRGKEAEEAQNELLLCARGAAEEVTKLLNSAIANAEHNQQIPAEELRVKEAFVDEGPTMKRFKARARGRGNRILKRTSHITIILERMTQEDIEKKAARDSESGAAGAREQRRPRAEASKAAQKAKEEALAEESDDSTSAEVVDGEITEVTDDSTEKAEPKKAAKKVAKKTTTKKADDKEPAKKVAKKTTAKKADDEAPVKKAAKKTTTAKKAVKKTTKKEGDA